MVTLLLLTTCYVIASVQWTVFVTSTVFGTIEHRCEKPTVQGNSTIQGNTCSGVHLKIKVLRILLMAVDELLTGGVA